MTKFQNFTHGGKRQGAGGPSGKRPKSATEKIELRVTEHEKKVFQDRAKAGNMSVSEYIKLMCISGSD